MPQNFSSNPSPFEPRHADGSRDTPNDAGLETDFADLAARFSAKSGGGLSPELSADLALEVVLNEIVEQACMATGATGAAIVLERDGEFVCRATSGATAPELGSRLDTHRGLSGECVRTRATQQSADVLTDARADLEASRHLGVRSVIVMPLLEGAEPVGVFELFSSRPSAFGERDEGTLEILAGRVLSNLQRAAQPLDVAMNPPTSLLASASIPNTEIPNVSVPKPWPTLGEESFSATESAPKKPVASSPEPVKANPISLGAALASLAESASARETSSTPTSVPVNLGSSDSADSAMMDSAFKEMIGKRPLPEPTLADGTIAQATIAQGRSGEIGKTRQVWSEEIASRQEDAVRHEEEELVEETEEDREYHFGFMNLVLSAAVLACAILLGVLIGRHLNLTKAAARRHAAVPAATAVEVAAPADTTGATENGQAGNDQPGNDQPGNDSAAAPAAPGARSTRPTVPPGGLRIFENGKEVFHLIPGETTPGTPRGEAASGKASVNSLQAPIKPAASIEPDQAPDQNLTNAAGVANLPPDAADDALLRRIEPEYPEQARAQKIQGPVVLEVRARRDGSVQDVKLLSGQPLLAGAAIAAVRQWQFKPLMVQGKPVAIETRVTLNFRLPQ